MLGLGSPLHGRMVLVLFLSLLGRGGTAATSAGDVPRPGKVAFTILYEQKGKNGIGPWQVSCVTKYSLSHWNEPLRDKNRRLPLELEPGAIPRLPVGAKVNFYPSEAEETGAGVGSSATRVLSADGVYRLTETDSSGTRTFVTTDADYRRGHNIPANAHFTQNARYYQLGDLAELTRTAHGAVLRTFSDSELSGGGEWSVDAGLEQRVLAKAGTFVLTDQELRNWREITKTNSWSESKDDEQLSVRMTLTMKLEEDEVEVAVVPEDGYQAWIPKGNLEQPDQPGDNPLKIIVTVHRKGDTTKLRKAYLDVALTSVSKNKGICGNWPAAAGEGEGLRFREQDFVTQDGLLYQGPTHLATDMLVDEAAFRIHSYDYGAWGTLTVTAKDEEGRPLKVKARGKESPDLSLPFDENHNHIADAWEKQWAGGLGGQETDDEDAEPQGDGDTGDALSLYDEYRGFRITGGPEATLEGGRPRELITGSHVRTDPRVKDIFVCDQLGLGLEFFRESRLQVHLVRAVECGPTKAGAFNPHIINPNRGDFSISEQYVLWLESGEGTLKGDLGAADMKPGNGPPGPPRDCRRILINAPAKGGSPWIDATKPISNTIAHELAHACYVKHHGETQVFVVKVEYLRDLLGAGGKIAHGRGTVDQPEPGDTGWSLVSGTGGSPSSGDTHCFMTYQSTFVEVSGNPAMYLWDAAGNRYIGEPYNCDSGVCILNRFCGVASTWRLGQAGPPALKRGDCLHQFCVNHLKHRVR